MVEENKLDLKTQLDEFMSKQEGWVQDFSVWKGGRWKESGSDGSAYYQSVLVTITISPRQHQIKYSCPTGRYLYPAVRLGGTSEGFFEEDICLFSNIEDFIEHFNFVNQLDINIKELEKSLQKNRNNLNTRFETMETNQEYKDLYKLIEKWNGEIDFTKQKIKELEKNLEIQVKKRNELNFAISHLDKKNSVAESADTSLALRGNDAE